jgi:hypothetical protein
VPCLHWPATCAADNEDLWLPRWQFRYRDTVLGLTELMKRFPGTLSRFVTTPHAELDGRTPAEELQRGRIRRVLMIADAAQELGLSPTAGPLPSPAQFAPATTVDIVVAGPCTGDFGPRLEARQR